MTAWPSLPLLFVITSVYATELAGINADIHRHIANGLDWFCLVRANYHKKSSDSRIHRHKSSCESEMQAGIGNTPPTK